MLAVHLASRNLKVRCWS